MLEPKSMLKLQQKEKNQQPGEEILITQNCDGHNRCIQINEESFESVDKLIKNAFGITRS